jgi:preprotein translocase subunit YajC
MQNVFPLLLIAVVYFAFVMPQRRKAKARLAELAELSSGDRVLLTSGVHGVVIGVEGPSLIVQVAPGTPLYVTRAAVARRTTDAEPGIPSLDALGVEEIEVIDPDTTIDLAIGELPAVPTSSVPEDGVPA